MTCDVVLEERNLCPIDQENICKLSVYYGSQGGMTPSSEVCEVNAGKAAEMFLILG